MKIDVFFYDDSSNKEKKVDLVFLKNIAESSSDWYDDNLKEKIKNATSIDNVEKVIKEHEFYDADDDVVTILICSINNESTVADFDTDFDKKSRFHFYRSEKACEIWNTYPKEIVGDDYFYFWEDVEDDPKERKRLKKLQTIPFSEFQKK